MAEFKVGQVGRQELVVTMEHTASAVGSGLLPVFATPQLVALMEHAACNAIEAELPPCNTSVGTRLEVSHTAATPVGMRVWAEATLTAVEGRALSFHIEAFDEKGSIGVAEHQRFLVERERFMKKVEAKLQ